MLCSIKYESENFESRKIKYEQSQRHKKSLSVFRRVFLEKEKKENLTAKKEKENFSCIFIMIASNDRTKVVH